MCVCVCVCARVYFHMTKLIINRLLYYTKDVNLIFSKNIVRAMSSIATKSRSKFVIVAFVSTSYKHLIISLCWVSLLCCLVNSVEVVCALVDVVVSFFFNFAFLARLRFGCSSLCHLMLCLYLSHT